MTGGNVAGEGRPQKRRKEQGEPRTWQSETPPASIISSRQCYVGAAQSHENAFASRSNMLPTSHLHSGVGDYHYHGSTASLRYVPQAVFNAYGQPQNACHPATRKDLLNDITQWAQRPNPKSIFWLNGMAGTGKSTIAYTIAQRLDQQLPSEPAKLGASFFFKRGEGDRASAALFFPTIAHQLRRKIPGLDMLIDEVTTADPDICSKSISEQFNKLLKEPLQRLDRLDSSGQQPRYIVVVDALDECESDDDVDVLLQLWPHLWSTTKISIGLFLTSRPELPIRLGFSKLSAGVHQDVILHEIPRPVIEHDVLVFLTDAFAQIRSEYNLEPLSGTPLSDTWPGKLVLKELTDLAVPLFIVALTICRFVQDRDWDPQEQLNIILQSRRLGHRSHVAQTYLPVLQRMASSITDVAARERLYSEFRLIVGAIVTVVEPLSRTSLALLLDLPPATITLRLRSLHSVLSVPPHPDAPIRPLHLSFREFLTSPEIQDQPHYIDSAIMHNMLATKCLTLLSQTTPIGLCENMCHLGFPGQAREDVSLTVIAERFPPALQYACRYWTYHVQQSKTQICDSGQVHTFLRKHFLHWLEAMSLLGRLADVIEQVQMLQSAVLTSCNATGVLAFLVDARRFILTNRHIIDLAPLQVYSSAIMFAPRNSTVRQVCGRVPAWIRQSPVTPEVWNAELQKLEGHGNWVMAVAFSPDGSQLASASADWTVRLWDVKTGQVKQTLKGHSGWVRAVVFSPDGSQLASASDDSTVRLWDVKTGQAKQTLREHSSWVSAVAFSPDGSQLASASRDTTVRLWDAKTGQAKQTLIGHYMCVNAVGFSPDGSQLASASDDWTVRLWDVKTCQTKQKLKGHSGIVKAVAFSPDGSQLASASEDNTVRWWDVKTGQTKQTLIGHNSWVGAVVFSPDGSQLASASGDWTVQLWDQKTGQVKQMLEGHSGSVSAVAFSPDGSQLASASEDNTVRLWDVKTGQTKQALIGHNSWVGAVVFSPDGSQLSSAFRDRTMRLWGLKTGQVKPVLEGHSGSVSAVVFSPSGSRLASASSDDSTVRLWDVKTGQVKQVLEGHSSWINTLAFSPDGSQLASASEDETVRLWDVKTGQVKQVLEGHSSWIDSVAFSPDGSQLASASQDQTVRLWDVKTDQVKQVLEGHSGSVRAAAFSPDGSRLASASQDMTVRLWDVKTGQAKQTLEGHLSWVMAVAFSPDSSQLASASGDLTVRLWDTETGREVQRFKGDSLIHEIKFATDSRSLLTNQGSITINAEPIYAGPVECSCSNRLVLKDEWIVCDGQRVLWLPHEYRSDVFAVHRGIIGIGRASGLVSFFQIQFT